MSFRNVFNILIVAVWISFQTAMSFAHGPIVGPMSGKHSGDGSHHAHAHGDHILHTHGADEHASHHGNHGQHGGSDGDSCGVTECSALGVITGLAPVQHRSVRAFDDKQMFALVPVNQGLPTPPPNSTI